jgi:beta-aspartyl-dipeptidase (metallo-type)
MLTLLRNADVYDPAPLGRLDMLVAAGQIVGLGRDLLPPRGVQTSEIDLEGARVVPGLVDAHVHLTGGGGESGPSSRVPPMGLSELALAGVTTCVGLLGTDTTTRTMESLVARTLGLREEGLSAFCWTGGYAVPPATLTGSVRRDIVYVDPIVGAGEIAISDHRSSQPTLDELLRLAADCHVGGLMSGKAGVLHLHLGDGSRGLDLVRRALETSELPAQVFHPTHVNRQERLFDEAIALAAHGVSVDVTAYDVADAEPGLSAVDAIEHWLTSKQPPALLTCSSDGAGCLPVFDAEGRVERMDVGRPDELARALSALLARGHELGRVLPFFTSNVARVLRLPNKGRIRAGADADLLVLGDGATIRDVMARGRWLVQGGIAVVRGPFEHARSAPEARVATPSRTTTAPPFDRGEERT